MAKAASSSSVLCSICWEEVSDTCGRTVVKLQCSHSFHLDCIGSAFNVSGVMQCPNCREIEHGVWRRFENNTEENVDEDSDDEDERIVENMLSHHCLDDNWCPRHGRIPELPHLGNQDLTEEPPILAGDHHPYCPSMISDFSSSPIFFHGRNLVPPAVFTPVCDHVIDANQTLVPFAIAIPRAHQCDAGGLPNFESAGHRAILQPGRRSNGLPGWLPAQNIPLPPPPIFYHVPPLNLTFQNNNPQAADDVDHSLSLAIQNNPPAPTLVNNHHVGERFETIQLLPADMGPFRAPRN